MSIRNINHRIIWIKNIIFSLAVFVLHLFCYKPLSFIRSDFWYRNQIGTWRWSDIRQTTIFEKCRKKSVAICSITTLLLFTFLFFQSNSLIQILLLLLLCLPPQVIILMIYKLQSKLIISLIELLLVFYQSTFNPFFYLFNSNKTSS